MIKTTKTPLHQYHPREEFFNALTHGIGSVLSVIATFFLLIKATYLNSMQFFGLAVYAASLVLLFTASTLYHVAKSETKRSWYKKLDHTAIYYLIAGTYTPFLSIALPTDKAKILLIALWIIAMIGTLFKLVFIQHFQKVSLVAYLVMGWLALLVIDDMQTYLSADTLKLLIAGGVAYTVGAIFYALKNIKYSHAIWHLFVLFGAAFHFFAIYDHIV